MLRLVNEPVITGNWVKVGRNLISRFKALFTCRKRCLFASECTPEAPRTSRRCDARLFSKSHVHVDPPNRRGPTVSARTGCQCNAWRCLAENLATRENVRKARRQFEDVAKTIPASVRPLRDRIQLRWDLMTAVMCGRDWWQTKTEF